MGNNRIKKYLLFMYGNWFKLEDTPELYDHIKDVLENILSSPELSFVTGEHALIACIESKLPFNEIDELLSEFLKPEIPVYFLMPKPKKLGYRLSPILERHLFKKNTKNIEPTDELMTELMKHFKKLKKDGLKSFIVGLPKDGSPLVGDESNFINPMEKTIEILDIDSILDKIYDSGLGSLTINEKEFLNKQKK
tara:strand:+ start:6274 stop:6855 length:582 start_codon:yes stop_codon:yes gene_type:complete